MKPLVLSEILPPRIGGSGRWLWEMYTRSERLDTVFVADREPGAETFDRDSNEKIVRLDLASDQWGVLNPKGLWYYLSTAFRVWRIFKKSGAQAIHCGRVQPEGVIALILKKLAGIPYICFIHGEDVEMARSSREYTWLVQRAITHADALICNSDNTRDLLEKNWQLSDQKRVIVIHPGVDTERFRPAPDNAQAREALGWQDRFVVLTVSRLQERKGHEYLIRALPKLRERHPSLLYAIVGNGPLEDKLRSLTTELGVDDMVRFYDALTDAQMIDCYQQCDVFVLPNRTIGRDIEGFGIVLIEAQASGKAVLAGNSGGTGEALSHGVTGELIDATSVESTAAAVDALLSDPDKIQRYASSARSWVEQNFSWPIVVEHLESAVTQPVSAHRKETQE